MAVAAAACGSPATAFQNLLPNLSFAPKPFTSGAVDLEDRLLAALEANGARLDNSDEIASVVSQLEASQSIPRPAIAPQVYGRWRLLQTTNADTASPIQRKAVDTTKFDIFQDIVFAEDDPEKLLVRQIVKFSETNELCVDALASTSAYPLPELTDRQGTGKILGLNILGVSLVGDDAEEDPERPDSRVRFVFDEGKFDFGAFTIPYPVPFRNPFFRDAVKGWIDITYLSDRIRISRGNKGTTFILKKEE
ncbi:hypothetical protein ACHAXT_008610 [Thalassiosira profunda]